MALTKKSIELPLIGGLDTKTDSKQVKLGKLLSAQNVSFKKPGKIMKRDGFQSLGQTIADTGALLTDGQAVMKYNEELLAFDKNNIYSYVSSTNEWKDKGNFQSIYLTSSPITNGVAKDYMCDTAYINGIELHVFMRKVGATDTLYYQAVDSATNQIIIGPVAVSNAATSPKVIAFDDQFVIFYYEKSTNLIKRGALSSGNVLQPVVFTALTDPSSGDKCVNSFYPTYDVLGYRLQGTGVWAIYLSFYSITGKMTTLRYDSAASSIPVNQT